MRTLCYFIGFMVLFTACEEELNIDIAPEIETPETYSFERNGATTISILKQQQLLQMGEELLTEFGQLETISEEELLNIYQNTNQPFTNSELNNAGFSLEEHVAASTDYFSDNAPRADSIQNFFTNLFFEQATEVKQNRETTASPGVAGQITDSSTVRYVNDFGVELETVLKHALTGAVFADQIVNEYFSDELIDTDEVIDNNDEDKLFENENYTVMEHLWDEGYALVFGRSESIADPDLNSASDPFFGETLLQVSNDEDFSGISQTIFNAFKLGRVAIVEKKYDVRNTQITSIRGNLSFALGVRAVFYLQQAAEHIEDDDREASLHDLSAALGYIYSLQFSRNPSTGIPYLSTDQVYDFIDDTDTGSGFWQVDEETLNEWSSTIADQFNFTVNAARN